MIEKETYGLYGIMNIEMVQIYIYINNPFLLRNNIDNPDDPDYQNPSSFGGKKKRKNKSKKTKSKKTKSKKTKKVRKTKRRI